MEGTSKMPLPTCLSNSALETSSLNPFAESADSLKVSCAERSLPALPTLAKDNRLPAELWSKVLSNFKGEKGQTELAYLWTVIRLVSRWFKFEIENIFKTEHLPKTWLHFSLPLNSREYFVNVYFGEKFDRFL